jgi:hypothetical protein
MVILRMNKRKQNKCQLEALKISEKIYIIRNSYKDIKLYFSR